MEDKLKQLEKVLADIRELKLCLVSKDVGVLKSLEIQFLGDDKPTRIAYK